MRGLYVAAVDFGALLEVVVASLLAGVGLTTLFSIVIYSATRALELRRDGSWPLTAFLGVVAFAGLAGCVVGIVFGIKVMVTK